MAVLCEDYMAGEPSRQSIKLRNRLYNALSISHPRPSVVPPHYHPELELVIPVGLAGPAFVAGLEFEMKNGCVVVVPPGAVHAFRPRPDPDGGGLVLQIDLSAIRKALSRFSDRDPAPYFDRLGRRREIPPPDSEPILRSVRALSLLTRSDKPGGISAAFDDTVADLKLLLGILSILSEGDGDAVRERKGDAAVRRVIDVIEAGAHEALSLETIAKKSALSRFHLCRFFKRATGVTVGRYVTHLRIRRACRMLGEEGKNVTQAAYDNGFESVSHFIAVFRRVTGETPKQWALKRACAPTP